MPGMTRNTHTEESAEVELLLANMEKLKGLTKKINGTLGRLETSGRSVQDAIRPVYGNTGRLQTTNMNIEKINRAIENLRQPLDRRRKEEDVIRAGLKRVDLHDYLASMDRTSQALDNLRETNMKANQEAVAELSYLVKFGSGELEGAFRDTLVQEASPVEPLRYVTKQMPFPNISEKNSSKLRVINAYMTNLASQRRQGEDPKTMIAYSEIRGPYISTSLQNLATASVVTVRKTDPSAIYKKGTSGISTYATALEQMFTAEYDNICPVFSREQWTRLHTLTCTISMSQLTSVLGDLNTHIRNNVLTDCYLAYEIVDTVSSLSFRLESKNPDLRQPIQDALRPIREQAKYSLQRLLDDTKSRAGAIMSLPSDASPVPVTADALTRLQTMTAYLSPLSSILASIGDGGWRSSSSTSNPSYTTANRLDVGANGTQLFTSYCTDTIDAVLAQLEVKAKGLLKTKSAQGIFLANNAALVERMLANSDLGATLLSSSDSASGISSSSSTATSARTKLDTWHKRARDMYTDPWKEPASHLRDVQYTNRASGSNRPASNSLSAGSGGTIDSAAFIKGLSNKDRDATKEKWKNFNASFEELVARHRGLRCEPEVRERLVREVSAVVEPLYDRFWDRYHEIDKGRGKYVRYDKGALRGVLQGLG